MDSIITYLLLYNQYLLKTIFQLVLFIAKHIPLKQWAFEDSNSPDYQKFKVDKLPKILRFEKIDYQLLLAYYKHKYNKLVKPINRRNGKSIPEYIICPKCGAPHDYIYDNNGAKGQYQCKVCGQTFHQSNHGTKPVVFVCPYCGRTLDAKKDRKHFRVHKCVNPKCSYYLKNISKLPKDLPPADKHKYKLHYIYREFTVDFFKMDLNSLPARAINFSFKKFNPHIMGLCLTYHVNLKLSTRQTAHALEEVHGIKISHTMVAHYATTAAAVIKPFVDSFNYKPSNILSADETYIKVKGIKHYVWFIMDTCKKSILGYQVSDNRAVGPCILAMRMAFNKFKQFPSKALKFIADGYSAYPLAAQQFKLEKGWDFDITQVIGLTNDDAVTSEFRWVKQVIERLNRTFKSSYRVTCGYGSENGALYGVSLWVAYYNFLRPHPYNYWRPLNELKEFSLADNMPAKWQILIRLGQLAILDLQEQQQHC
ncbi:DDE-type integrase/transposase/recombinase [Clostridium oryzae]|uniref:Transposase IS66 family protein n=1 Tax=Clostridium oryzae TaxID=1450648 RepID=A0A1V4I3W8_9CLOT|nr:DDE-type integrase/transposase/recombinase [Clostridium oryzae]OPJ54560.1 transposase IS66 family protein [Clostridium oryzae]